MNDCKYWDNESNFCTLYRPTAQQWIPCSERLPKEGELVLICFRSAKDTPHWRIQVGHLGNHDVVDYHYQKIDVAQVWYTDRFYWSFLDVIAWLPLPEPYKEKA